MIEEMVNVRMMMESRALSERSFVTLDGEHEDNFDEIASGHNKTMFLLEKRSKSLEGMLELWELGGVARLFPAIARTELAVQCNIFNAIFTTKPKPSFISIDCAEALLEVCLKLGKSKSNYYAEISGRCAGIILREISQTLCGMLATSLQVDKNAQLTCVKVFKILEEIGGALKKHNRGILELNEIEFFVEKLGPRVAQLKFDPPQESFF